MKKLFIALMGGTVVLIGVAMLILPGPGLLAIAGGLAILATEFIWARRALRNAKGTVAKVRRKSGLKEWLRRQKARRRKAGDGGEDLARDVN
jgi:uncharacterized protein (TIGR02611 family)